MTFGTTHRQSADCAASKDFQPRIHADSPRRNVSKRFEASKPGFPGAELFAFIRVHLWLKMLLLFSLLPATPSIGSLVSLWVIIHEHWY